MKLLFSLLVFLLSLLYEVGSRAKDQEVGQMCSRSFTWRRWWYRLRGRRCSRCDCGVAIKVEIRSVVEVGGCRCRGGGCFAGLCCLFRLCGIW